MGFDRVNYYKAPCPIWGRDVRRTGKGLVIITFCMSTLQSRDELSWQRVLMRIGIIAICTIVIVIAMPQSSAPQYNAKEGSPWTQAAVTATFDFDIPKDSAIYRAECDSVRKSFAPYYTNDLSVSQIQIKRFVARNQNGIDGLPNSYISLVAKKLAELYSQGIIPQADYARLSKDSSAFIRVVTGKMSQSHRVRNLLTPMSAYEKFFADSQISAVRSQLQKCNINEYFTANLKYDSIRSNDELSGQIALIAAKCGQVKKGERIIDRGEIIKDETLRKLNAYSSEMEKHLSDKSKQTTLWGRVMFIFIMLSIFSIYLHLFRADYFEKPRSLAMVYCLIALFPVLVSLMVQYNIFSVYVLPLAMLPMFVRVFLDSRTAFIAHITMVLICSLVLTMPYEFLLIQITSGLVAIYSLRELSKRSQIFTAAVYTSLAAFAAYYALQLMQPGEEIVFNQSMAIHFIFSGILLLLAYPLMFLVEKVFGFTSSVTLFELSDTNKNLLRRLSEVAPGTLQHSITVGNIGAEIASKIGAKSLLVRVGALYHDIGKISAPAFFTENQRGNNPHDRLTPIESAEIIVNHVQEGLRIAEREGLPDVICDFIRTHHGEGMAKYFYITEQNEHPDVEVDKAPFTYPGPNPFTREQAILMMADGVEAASRSLQEYSEEGITELVNRIIDGMVADGYFRECPITFRDIATSKRVLIDKLKSMYHTRITYPELNK